MIQVIGQRLFDWLREESRSERLLPDLTSGVVTGIAAVMFALSLGSLIFSGELAPFLPYGVRISLITATIMLVVTSLASSVTGVIGIAQDTTSVILAVIAATLAGRLSAIGTQEKLATILVAISATTLLAGVLFWGLGSLQLGKLVRFIPYPVVGGFMAGTGWLLAQGSFGVMTDFPLTLSNVRALLQPDQLLLWVPGVLFALALFFGLRRIHHFMAMPGILVGAILVFYLALWVTGTSIQSAMDHGLLLGAASGQAGWQPLSLSDLLAANWMAILGQSGNVATILVLGVVGLLLNASALELAIRQDIDLNRELRAAGIANIVSALGGGMAGYHALTLSTLSYRIGARGRLPGLVAGILCALILFAGAALLTFFPKPLLGGLLFYLGLDFLVDWVIAGWHKLSRADYAVVVLILVVIGTTNLLIGVGVGLAAMIVLFVLNYSRINVVHHALSGSEARSNLERCAYHRRVLAEQLGQHIHVFELQGFIFFGTANALLEQIRGRLTDTQRPKVRYLILDFRRVIGLDSSAIISFVKCNQITEAQGIILVLTHLSERTQHRFALDGLSEGDRGVRILPDLDRGLEWCEEQLLESERITTLYVPVTLSAQLADSGFKKTDTARLGEFLERIEFAQGEYLIRQGQEADRLYFIEHGIVSVFLEMDNGKRVRLQTLGLGTAVGEPGLYLGTTCTASVIADWPVIAYRLTRKTLSEMKEREPELAATFHEFVARLLSERLVATTRTLEAVLK